MNVAIAGYDVEGRASAEYYKAAGHVVTILDKNEALDVPSEFESKLGDGYLDNLDRFDLIVRTPGLAPSKLVTARPITSATKEFFKQCPATIIGVTGTKGKGTTCTLIHKMLQAAGLGSHLVGNIGNPALTELANVQKDDFVVYELSSFQLWDLDQSPAIAVVLMIEPDHLDTHDSMEDYIDAKANIARFQKPEDSIVYYPTSDIVASIAEQSAGKKLRYLTPDGAHLVGEGNDRKVVVDNKEICSVSEVGLLGEHNLENICAAVTVCWQITQDVDAMTKVAREFKGLPYHLEPIGEVDGVQFFNDSFSAAPLAAVAGTKAIKQPKIMIYGGYDKGADLSPIARVAQEEQVKKALLIGQTASKIADEMDDIGFRDYEALTDVDMAGIVSKARELAEPGDAVVLSPGCASFGMFQNYKDRGDQFSKVVGGLV